MYTVEILTYKDVVWSVEVAAVRMLTEELGRPELVNRPHLYSLADKIIQEKTATICKKNGEPVGILASLLVPNTYNPEIKTLAELFWYVIPEARKGRAGALLLEAHINMAKNIADEATLSTLGSSEVNPKTLTRKGFIHEENAYRIKV